MKCVSLKSNKILQPSRSSEPLKQLVVLLRVTVRNITVEEELTVIEGEGQAVLGRET